MLRFNNHLVCSIHSRYPFCVHSSLSQSLCSLMLRSSTPSFAQLTQHSCSMANASFRSSGKNVRLPNHVTSAAYLPHPLRNCQDRIPWHKKSATPAGAVGVRRPHTSGFFLPPHSLHSQRLAPGHSARKNRSLRSPVFPLLRSCSRLHNLLISDFNPLRKSTTNKFIVSENIIKLAITAFHIEPSSCSIPLYFLLTHSIRL